MTSPRTHRIAGTIPGRPIAFARPVDVQGRRVNPARYREWKTAAGYYVLQHRGGRRQLDGPLGIELLVGPDGIAYEAFELTGDHRPKGVTGDLDNYTKATLDALQGVAFPDDKLVQFITVRFTNDLEEDLTA